MTKQSFCALICGVFALLVPVSTTAQPKIKLENFASGFTRPVDVAHCGDSRLFVVEQTGYIWILDSLGNRLPEPFLDIDTRVRSTGNEQGLLGLAFPPDYAETGWFYVNYTRETDGDTRVSRFRRDSLNPDKADPDSELYILTQDQPFPNHNGGCIKFGPDGYLYIALGDGGSGNDPQNNGQKKTTFLGKILRIDVSNSSVDTPYVVPADNPFVGNSDYLPEIWSLGWRNPWRFSFDRLTGDMWIGDVGQGTYEEIDVEAAGAGGLNYGWRCYEGLHPFNTNGCGPSANYVSPIFEYAHNNGNGCSVTGGFIYRGSKYPDLYGNYLFADYCSGRWWRTRPNPDGTYTTSVLATLSTYEYSSMGEDKDGELYVTLLGSGKIQKITELCSTFELTLDNIFSPVCANSLSGFIFLKATGAADPVNYVWSNGISGPESSIIYLNPGVYSVAATDANGCVRRDTFLIEQKGPNAPLLAASDTVLCSGASIVLTASGLPVPNELNWFRNGQLFTTTDTDENVVSLTVNTPGEYQAVLMDTTCSALFSPVRVITEETAIEPSVTVSGDTLFAGAPGTPCDGCQWLLDNEPIPGATESFYVATQSGIYELEITSPNGCKYQSSGVEVTVSVGDLPASVRHFSLSPNPASDEIMLKMELERTARFTISLSDAQQRQIFLQTHQNQRIALPIDLRALPAGTYFLKVQTDKGQFVRKVIRKH